MQNQLNAIVKGKLYLIPSLLGGEDASYIPAHTREIIFQLNEFIVENARSARRYLRQIGYTKNFDTEVLIHELDKHAVRQDCQRFMKHIDEGISIGLVSEAGNPCIADPGSELVAYAHSCGIAVVPLVGPSSILLALIASGMNGQQFTFNGYLPIDHSQRVKSIKTLERLSLQGNTQIFMETPFRNQKLLEEILLCCGENTRLGIACDLTLDSEFIKTQTIREWRLNPPDLHKRYVIFLLG